jgi:hypothetical protein
MKAPEVPADAYVERVIESECGNVSHGLACMLVQHGAVAVLERALA